MGIGRFEEPVVATELSDISEKIDITTSLNKDEEPLKKANIFLILYSLFFITVASTIFRFFVKLFDKEIRFEKESKPFIKFKTVKSFFTMWLIMEIIAFPIALYLTNTLVYIFNWLVNTVSSLFNNTAITFDITIFSWKQFFHFSIILDYWILFFIIFLAFSVYTFKKSRYYFERFRDYNNNEHGDDKLLEPKQLKKTYKRIPNKTESFKGYGGIPVSHEVKGYGYKNPKNWLAGNSLETKINFHFPRKGDVSSFSSKMLYMFGNRLSQSEKALNITNTPSGHYYIEDGTVNALVTGMTRSGKGETLVNPTIDNLSRAEKKASMVIGDPKGELYRMWSDSLEKRGYNVMALNFLDMESSMSYNPLYLAIEYAKKGYYEETQIQINRIAEAIYRTGSQDGATKYFEDSSISLFNAIALALMWRADESYKVGELDSWETVTLRNLVEFLTKLGSESIIVDNKGNKKSKLTFYFDGLKEINKINPSKFLSMADNNFRSSDFSGDEQKGNIYSSMLAGISLYMNDSIAKLTSKNSIDLRSIGFPRRISLKATRNETYKHTILKNQVAYMVIRDFETKKIILNKTSAKVDIAGYMTLLVESFLPNKFTLEISFNHPNNTLSEIEDELITVLVEKKDGEFKATTLEQTSGVNLLLEDIEVVYSEQPSAVFMILPPSRKEYGIMASFFIDQMFNVNFELAGEDGKCQNRIVSILDEFGNLPKIPSMSTKLSIGLSAGLLFILFVQNLEQIVEKYNEKDSISIISNCSINMLIKTTSEQTAKSYSEASGTKTIYQRTKTSNPIDNSNSSGHSQLSVNNSSMGQPLLTVPQLLKLRSGEAFISVGVKANTLAGAKTTNHPILVKDKYQYPYRYMFLFNECDSSKKFADLKVNSEHQNLDLKDVELNYSYEFDTIMMYADMHASKRIDKLRIRKGYNLSTKKENISEDEIKTDVNNKLVQTESEPEISVGFEGFNKDMTAQR